MSLIWDCLDVVLEKWSTWPNQSIKKINFNWWGGIVDDRGIAWTNVQKKTQAITCRSMLVAVCGTRRRVIVTHQFVQRSSGFDFIHSQPTCSPFNSIITEMMSILWMWNLPYNHRQMIGIKNYLITILSFKKSHILSWPFN